MVPIEYQQIAAAVALSIFRIQAMFDENPRAFFYFLEKFSPPQTGEFFESQKEEHFHFSKNSPGETGTSFCLKKSLNIAKMVEKRFELPVSTHDLAYEKIRLADSYSF